MSNRHRDPKWKMYRANQTVRVKLPEYDELRKNLDDMPPEQYRSYLKEKGIVPPRQYVEKPLHISCSGTVTEAYVPPEGDGRASLLSKIGSLQRMKMLEMKGKSRWHLRTIRQFDEDFKLSEFAQTAHEIYLDVHTALADGDMKKIEKLVTERCYPDIIANTELKTLRWSFVKSLEPPRVVHVRTQNILTKDNIFAQVTVRLHTQQTLAVYDRFGQLMHGSEVITKDVLEYVVYEKHMSNEYGQWRIHAKIIPQWQPLKSPLPTTTILRDASSTPEPDADATDTAVHSSQQADPGPKQLASH